ncbi:MCE family protein [Nocardia mangyaensis]|uniref:MCE family protein n=1 Tax=Nocardia mangyaensis TaxID=2213200 RepID=A0A1J0W2W5_9NOCA|nr:MlaD family protein [Nocardia mangyaensis]APE38618.1 MCE family protein [Nocardia mangyaensis]
MWRQILGSRGLMSAAVVLTLVLVGALGLRLSTPNPAMRGYCADMPDSIGLYEGSAVTVMGVQVGRVTGISVDGASARVEFLVRADRTLPVDVGAVTVSDTLIADRRLALIGAEPAGPGWDSSECITNTLTPKSLTQTFDALAALADQLNGAGDPAQRDAVGAGIDALDRATVGTGEQINDIIVALSRALAAPEVAIGHLGQLLDALTDLAHRARGGWSQVETTVSGLPQTFDDIVTIAFPPIIEIVDTLADLLPQLNDVIVLLGSPALRAVDSVPDLSRMIAAGVGSLADIIAMAPAVASGFAGAVDPVSGALTIGYAPPRLALAQQDTAQVCAALQVVTGHHCQAEDGAMTIPALPVLLGAVSAR